MIVKEDFIIEGSSNKPILIDARYQKDFAKKPIIIFCHGFKGFKDFGCFNLLADFFAEAGFIFLKFNFSYNGTTPQNPIDFVDLDAFARNNFTIELDDLGLVIDEVTNMESGHLREIVNPSQIYLIGHSRGGGIAILKTSEDLRIKKLITWASVNEFGKFWNEETMSKWKKDGIRYEPNMRTKQNMPMYYSLYENLDANKDRLNIPAAIKNITQDLLVVHGDKDETVPKEVALEIKNWNPNIQLKIIENTNHTFDAKHPWNESNLPLKSLELAQKSVDFLKL